MTNTIDGQFISEIANAQAEQLTAERDLRAAAGKRGESAAVARLREADRRLGDLTTAREMVAAIRFGSLSTATGGAALEACGEAHAQAVMICAVAQSRMSRAAEAFNAAEDKTPFAAACDAGALEVHRALQAVKATRAALERAREAVEAIAQVEMIASQASR